MRLDVRPIARAGIVALGVLGAIGASPAHAQQITPPDPAPPAPAQPADPLGRETPRGTITGLTDAVYRGDFAAAARFLQLTPAQQRNAEGLARDLTALIERHFTQAVGSVSDARDGDQTDGLPADREHVELRLPSRTVDLELVRVPDPYAGQIWLVSSKTLAAVPALRRSADRTWLEQFMPAWLLSATFLGTPLARWIAWAATFAIPLALLWLVSLVVLPIGRWLITDSSAGAELVDWYTALRWPAILLGALVVHLLAVPLLGFSLRFRLIYGPLTITIGVLVAAWLVWRVLSRGFVHARVLALRRGQAGLRSLLLLGERVSKVIVVLAAIFVLLTVAGVDTSTALAGVGLGGVALALGAQRSIENLLGGVFLLTDRALAVGDTCAISDRLGVVEDITLRSVRLRTFEQTLLSVPAGLLAQSSVENFATRTKILVRSTLRIRYGASADQLRRVLNGIRAVLDARADVETATSRIRLVDFGERAIELELFAYVLTTDFGTFLAAREDLLLQIATIVEDSGAAFAEPMAVLHHAPEEGVGGRESAAAEAAAAERGTLARRAR